MIKRKKLEIFKPRLLSKKVKRRYKSVSFQEIFPHVSRINILKRKKFLMSNSMFRSVNRIVPVKFILFKNNKFFIKKKDNFLKKIAPICVLGMFI